MATLDLRGAHAPIMPLFDLVKFAAVAGAPTGDSWSYLSTGGSKVTLTGTNLIFDASGSPIAGMVTAVTIDARDDGAEDLVITGLATPAAILAAAAHGSDIAAFWRPLLGGDDVILGPEAGSGGTGARIFGDLPNAAPGVTAGGGDLIGMGDRQVTVYGDVQNVGDPRGGPTSRYFGGDDDIAGLITDAGQFVSGDAFQVIAGNTLEGGDDVILAQSRSSGAKAVGDADAAAGRVIGGDDYMTGGKDHQGQFVGDVGIVFAGGVVTGGDDTLNGGDRNETLIGDVERLNGGRLDGGDDAINGGGGNDIIVGDAFTVRADSSGSGGDDVIHGGGSNDTIYGDFTAGGGGIVGGADRLHGDDGADTLFGEGGADTLDGGAGVDRLLGGTGDDWLSGGAGDDTLFGDEGNDMLDGGGGADALAGLQGDDTYFVNDAGDTVTEIAGLGTDTVWTTLATSTLAANVENLRYNGPGAFTGTGNALANRIEGSAGADRLDGGAGDDVLVGGAGADYLLGGAGRDTASYATASAGVEVWMEAPGANSGEAEGDAWVGVEDLAGSTFGDMLAGDAAGNRISGGGGNDTLAGQNGADRLRGGAGADILFGDAGADVFDFDAPSESTAGARDVIRGGLSPAFEGAGAAGGDVIDLAGIDANATVAGNQAFAFGGVGIGRVSVVASGGDSLVRANTDNDAAFELQILIEDGALSASAYRSGDFVL